MKVSIIIPAYNAQATIRKAVNSALKQDIPKKNFEIIVVNDSSTDNTLSFLKPYIRRIRVINQKKNQGFLKTANKGFRKARGKYVIKLDSDDYFKPTILKEMVKVLEKNPEIDFVYCDYYDKLLNGKTKRIYTKNNIFNTIGIGILLRKNKFAKEGFFNERVKFAEYDLLLKTKERWRGYHVPKPLFCYNRRKESITKNENWIRKAIDQLRKLYPEKLKEIKKIRKY